MIILGIKIENKNSIEFQKILQEYKCQIKTRLGLHDADEEKCDIYGVILLELVKDMPELERALNKIGKVQKMFFK